MKDMDKLIAGAQQHDPRDFERLYRICTREIGWYCKRLCGNEFDAQDLLQEVWLTAWQKLPQYAGINFPAWLRSIAHNTFLNTLKKYRLEQLTEEPPDTAPEDELLGPVHITEQRILRRMLLHTIDRELTSVQRMTVLLYYYDDLPVSEIAERMECSGGLSNPGCITPVSGSGRHLVSRRTHFSPLYRACFLLCGMRLTMQGGCRCFICGAFSRICPDVPQR